MDTKETIRRGDLVYEQVYEGRLRAELEKTAPGRYVAINIDTGEHLVAETRGQALDQFHARFPAGSAYLVRVGTPLRIG